MQRDRDNKIGRGRMREWCDVTGRQERQGAAMLHSSVVFEAVDEFPDWTVKQGRGAGRGKAGWFADAVAADMVFAGFRLEGDSADLAQGGFDQDAPFQASCTEVQLAGIRDKGFAEMAAGRKENVEQCFQHRNYSS